VYNPAIARFRNQLLMAYRVDFGYEKPFRVASAICLLDENLRVIPESVTPLSDTIDGGAANHYDARFLVHQERLFVHYNNDWNTIPNQIHLVELDPDTLEARSPARVLELEGARQLCEKNWLLFDHDGELFAVYQIDPHIVLRVDLAGKGPVRCLPIYRSAWDTTAYTRRYGTLRGGTPPVRIGTKYVSFFHSRMTALSAVTLGPSPIVRKANQQQWLAAAGRWFREYFAPVRYYGGLYAFAAEPPFAPTDVIPQPLLRPEHEGRRRQPTASHMTPRRVVYPCGLVRLDNGQWLVSYGVHDERPVMRVYTHMAIGDGSSNTQQGVAP
jgi:hypothetical protein